MHEDYDDWGDAAFRWVTKSIKEMRQSLEGGEKLTDPDIVRLLRVESIKENGYLVTAHIVALCEDGTRRKFRVDVTDEPRTEWHPGHYEFEVTEEGIDAEED